MAIRATALPQPDLISPDFTVGLAGRRSPSSAPHDLHPMSRVAFFTRHRAPSLRPHVRAWSPQGLSVQFFHVVRGSRRGVCHAVPSGNRMRMRVYPKTTGLPPFRRWLGWAVWWFVPSEAEDMGQEPWGYTRDCFAHEGRRKILQANHQPTVSRRWQRSRRWRYRRCCFQMCIPT